MTEAEKRLIEVALADGDVRQARAAVMAERVDAEFKRRCRDAKESREAAQNAMSELFRELSERYTRDGGQGYRRTEETMLAILSENK